jgi:site-specific DNA recombinase
MASPEQLRAASYVRVSTDEQTRGFSLDGQRKAIEDRAASDGAALLPIFTDAGISGAKADRPAYQAMLAAAAAGEFETLYVWKFDRLGRDAEELLRARRMLEAVGVTIVSLTEGEAESTLIYGVRALVAQEEREKIGERTRMGLEQVARTGRQPCGQPPLGYRSVGSRADRSWVIDEREAKILRRIVALYLAGKGVNTIARTLNREGVPPVSVLRGKRAAGRWSPRPLLDILDSPVYEGKIRHQGLTYAGSHERLLDEETVARIRSLREARKKSAGGGRGRLPKRHLLVKGLARCGRCGGGMAARTFPKTGDYYVCARRHSQGVEACDMPTIRRADVDDRLLGFFLSHLHDATASIASIRAEADRQAAEAEAAAATADREALELDDQLGRVRRDYRDGRLTADEWRTFSDEIADERAAVTAKAVQLRRRADAIAAELEQLDTDAEFAGRLASIRDAVAGRISEASEDLGAVRAALTSTFDSIALHALDDGTVYAMPNPRHEAIEVRRRGDGVNEVGIRKAPIQLASRSEASVASPPGRRGRAGRRSQTRATHLPGGLRLRRCGRRDRRAHG